MIRITILTWFNIFFKYIYFPNSFHKTNILRVCNEYIIGTIPLRHYLKSLDTRITRLYAAVRHHPINKEPEHDLIFLTLPTTAL